MARRPAPAKQAGPPAAKTGKQAQPTIPRQTRSQGAALQTGIPPKRRKRGKQTTQNVSQPQGNQASGLGNVAEENEDEEEQEEEQEEQEQQQEEQEEEPEEEEQQQDEEGEEDPVDDPDASPTTSEGPEIRLDLKPSDADLNAARRRPYRPLGFTNPCDEHFRCYFNSVVVVLLHSDRIIQWISQRYLKALDKVGIEKQRYADLVWVQESNLDELDVANLQARSLEELKYTDVLCELFYLSLDFIAAGSQKDLDMTIEDFWIYLQIQNSRFNGHDWEFKGQQDATAFLRWLVELAKLQREKFVNDNLTLSFTRKEKKKLESLRDLDIRNIIGFQKTTRHNCIYCHQASNTKRRLAQPDEDNVLSFSVLKPIVGRRGRAAYEAEVDMYERLLQSFKSDHEEAVCATCALKIQPMKDRFETEEDAIKGDQTLKKREKDRALKKIRARHNEELEELKNYTGYSWTKMGNLPEVLFLSLNRSADNGRTKHKVVVHIPSTLDLSPVFEHRVTMPEETNYRIVGIVSHRGRMEGGHYIAQTFTKQYGWTEFNDDTLSPTNLDAIINQQRRNRFTPYLVMYEKIPSGEAEGDEHDSGVDQANRLQRINNGDAHAPTIYSRPIESGSPGLRLEVATSQPPDPGQGHLIVNAEINNQMVRFPVYVVENHLNSAISHSKITMCLKDSQGTLHLEARQGQLPGSLRGSSKRPSEELQANSEHDASSSTSKRRRTNSSPSNGQSNASSPDVLADSEEDDSSTDEENPGSSHSSNENENEPDPNPSRASGKKLPSAGSKKATTPTYDDDGGSPSDFYFYPTSPPAGTGLTPSDSLPESEPPESPDVGTFGRRPWNQIDPGRSQDAPDGPRRQGPIPPFTGFSQGNDDGPTVPKAPSAHNANARPAAPAFWGDATDDEMDPFATTWAQPRLSPTRRFSPGNSRFAQPSNRPRYFDYDFNASLDRDATQLFLHRKRNRMSLGSHGDADSESTVAPTLSSASSEFGDGGGGVRRYLRDGPVRPAAPAVYIPDGEEVYDLADGDGYYDDEDEERAYVLGMDGDVDMGVGPDAEPRDWHGYV